MLMQIWLGCRVWSLKPPALLRRCLCNLLSWQHSFSCSLMRPGRDGAQEDMPGATGKVCTACAFLAVRIALTHGTGCPGAVKPGMGWPWQRRGCPCAPPAASARAVSAQSPADPHGGQQDPDYRNWELHPCQQHNKKALVFCLHPYLGVSVLLESCIKLFLMQQSALLLSSRDRFSDNLFSQHSQLIFI